MDKIAEQTHTLSITRGTRNQNTHNRCPACCALKLHYKKPPFILDLINQKYHNHYIMHPKLLSLLLTLTVLWTTLLVPTHQYSCLNASALNYTQAPAWTNCYQQYDGSIAGYTNGSFKQCWWGQCGDWSYDYNKMGYLKSNLTYNYGLCYYATFGENCCTNCNSGVGTGAGQNCPVKSWQFYCTTSASTGKKYCDYFDSYNNCGGTTPLIIYVYVPCHPYCATCTAFWDNTKCQSCNRLVVNNTYQWLNWADTSYTQCDTYCPSRSDNLYAGQYIANTSNLTCSWCLSTCSRCTDLNNGGYCRTCVTTAYLLTDRSLCLSTFPSDTTACAAADYVCVTTCPSNLYFPVSQANANTLTYDWAYYNSDPYVRQTNVCYLCHRYCYTCTDKYDYSCSACAYGFFKWQQYGSRCGYFCKEGSFAVGGLVGQYVDPVYSWNPSTGTNYTTYRQCKLCDPGCQYCASSSSTCYQCQDNYFLLDDRSTCTTTFNCPICTGVTDGCAARDKLCRLNNCPTNFYFPVYRTGYTNQSSSTYSSYLFFTQAVSLNYSNNYYAGSSDPRTVNTSTWSPNTTASTFYRYNTNFCKLCDYRCMTCFGPTNSQCNSCVNLFYKWTNATVCDSYCPVGQYQQKGAAYPTNQTVCANCDVKCQVCTFYSNNCSLCVVFPNTNYAFLYNYSNGNSTCMTVCPASTTPLNVSGYYGSIATMQCYVCPGGCSNCNIDYLIANYVLLQSIECGNDTLCSKGIICTSCLSGYSLVGGACIPSNNCRLYSYYIQGNSSSSWNPANCYCLDGNYFSSNLTCSSCDITCLTCNGPNSNNCLTCPQGFVLSSGSCAQSQVYRNDFWRLNGTSVNTSGQVGNNFNNFSYCGSYYTLFGYQSSVTTSNYLSYTTPVLTSPNFYAISIRMKVLFIDNWEGTAGLYFTLGSPTSQPFSVYTYTTFGAMGQMQCGTNAMDYLLTIATQANLSPVGSNNQYSIYVSPNKNAVLNSTGFYYYWGIKDAVFTVLKCHTECSTCNGPGSNQCKGCSDPAKTLVNGICVCNTTANYFYTLGAPPTSACQYGCPTCFYTAGNSSNWCYYRDYVLRACVNPPTNNCSAPYSYGQPYELLNTYGTCVQNCSSGYFAIQSLMKCTSNCSQFNLYFYKGASAFGATMDMCVSKCPSGLIADPSSMWCVIRCPSSPLSFLMIQNRDTDPKCTTNCSPYYEYDVENLCVTSCPSGYYTQTINAHNKCVQTCTNAFGNNVTFSCVLSCPSPSYADPLTHLCSNTCSNGSYPQVMISNGNRTCVSQCQSGQWLHPYYQTCSPNPLDCPIGTYADNSTHKCEIRCTVLGQVGQNTTRMCQTACITGFAYWDIGVCVSMCPTNPSLFGYVNGNIRICVSSCNSTATGLYADVKASRICVANCSATPQATFGDNSTSVCVKQCPVSNQYGDPYHPYRQCVTSCSYSPIQTYAFYVTKLCLSVCPDGYFGDNTTTANVGVCSASCNLPYYGDVVSKLCVLKCSAGYFGSQVGAHLCVKVCPAGWYGMNATSNRVCVQTCDPGYWADSFTRMCYNVKTMCSNNTYADPQARLCVDGTLCTVGTYADPLTMGCESACTNASYFGDPSTNLCVLMCPASPDYYSQSGYCKASCTGGRYADKQANRTCGLKCSITPIPLYGTANYRCVNASQCGALSLFGNNNTQLCGLCSGSLPFGDPITNQCVYNCSANYYGDFSTNMCVLACNFSLFLYADNYTQQCTTFCTLGTFGVNSSSTPICQKDCPVGSYALETLRICVANCGSGFFLDYVTSRCFVSAVNCSSGYFGNNVSSVCVLPTDCQIVNSLHYYADIVTKLCTDKCQAPNYAENTSLTCVPKCLNGLFGENNTRMCSPVTACGLYLSFADNQTNVCVSKCSTTPLFTYAQNITYTCVIPADCPTSMFAENVSQSCVYYCPATAAGYSFGDSLSRRCVARCPEGYFGDISSGYAVCVSVCPGGNYFRDNRTQNCVYTCPAANSTTGFLDSYGDINTGYCVYNCPLGWFAQNEINRTCMQVCQAGTWGNPVTRMCISNPATSCPSGTWADNFTNLCVTVCGVNATNGQYFYGENTTRLCTPTCPASSFAYIPTRVCIDICPYLVDSGVSYYGDPGTLPTPLCVTNCLTANYYKDIANKRKCQPSCSYNSSYKSYKDPTKMMCVARCPSYPLELYSQGNSSATAICGSSCPAGQSMLDSNMSCVTACPILLDPTTNKCVTICSFSSALNTVLYADTINNVCVTSANCPANTYASDDSLTCVSTCPNGTYISGKNCVVICPDGTYINPNTQACVIATSCPPNYYGNNQTGTCEATCTGGTFGDPITRICLTQCYGSNYGDPLLGICSSSCSSGLIKSDLTMSCVGSCSLGYFYSQYNSSCVSDCPNGTFGDSKNQLCVIHCSSDPMTFGSTLQNNSCVSVCPISEEWFDLINRLCTATCPSSTYQYELNMSCVSFCPPPYYAQGMACTLNCAASSSYADDISRKCLATCPIGYFKDPTTNKCVVSCSATPLQYFAENTTQSCVLDCLSGYTDIQKGICVAVCSVNPVFYAEPNTRKCVQLCPPAYNEFADPLSQSCVTICPNGYYADNRERRCLQSCGNIFFSDSLTNPPACVSTCTISTYADPLLFRCVTSCSAGYYSFSGNSTCLQFCPYGYFADNSTGSCVQQCLNLNFQYADDFTHQCTNNCSNLQFGHKPTAISYGTCHLFCPNGYFSDPTTMKCVVKCPNGYFGNTNNNTCKTTCPENHFMDPINNLCQTTCPAANSLFGEPFSRYCVADCSSTGYNFLFADPILRKCTIQCSANQFGDPITLNCVTASNCSVGLVSDFNYNLCVPQCSNNTFESAGNCYAVCPIAGTYADAHTQSCVIPSQCANGFFGDPSKGACVEYCDITSNSYADTVSQTCVLSCPSPLFAESVTRTCATTCPSTPQYYGINSSRICVLSCPNNTFGDPSSNLCVIKCADGFYGDQNTWTCVTTCPLPYFGDNSTNLCVSTCPSTPNYFADPFTLICVFTCSDGLFSDPLNNRKCSSVCLTPNFAQISTKSCVSNCLTGFADPSTGQCAGKCTQNYYGYNFVCYADQCPSTTPPVYGDDTARLCVSICPVGYFGDPSSGKCVLVCPIAFNSFGYALTRECVTMCPAGTYADFSSRQCVITCPAIPALYSTTQPANLCVPNCTNGFFSSNATRSCVSNCPTGTYADNTTYTCAASCPTMPMMWGDNLTNSCVYTCSVTYDRFADNSSGLCVIECPEGTFAEPISRSCQPLCADGYFAVNSTRRCQTICPSGSFANSLNKMCVAVCPLDPIYYGDPIIQTCVQICPNGTYANPANQQCAYLNIVGLTCSLGYYADPTSNFCVKVCPRQFELYGLPTSGVCQANCPSPYFADNSTMRCVNMCPTYPSLFGDNNTRKCLQFCPNNTYSDNSSRVCVSVCPSGSFADNTTGRCVSVCPSTTLTYGNPISNKCEPSCPQDYFIDYYSFLCVQTCPQNTFANNFTQQCLKVCPNNSYGYLPTRTCVLSCYNNTYLQPFSLRCVDICPRYPALYANNQTMTCVPQCPQGMFTLQSTRTCVYECPLGLFRQNSTKSCVMHCTYGSNTFADNLTGYCVTSCSSGTFADDLTSRCVSMCPKQPPTFGQNISRTCVNSCPVNSYAQNLTRTCVSQCPSGSYSSINVCLFICPLGLFGQTVYQSCVAQCVAPFYADPTTRLCVSQCPINQLLYADNATRTCVSQCPTGSYAYQGSTTCVSSCPIVNAPLLQTYAYDVDNTCVEQCPYPYASYLPTLSCISQCPQPYYTDVNKHKCQLCSMNCILCNDNTSCIACALGFYLQQSQCVANCTLIYYANSANNQCVTSPFCAPSLGVNSTHKCQNLCPAGEWANIDVYRCDACPSTCITCSSPTFCQACITQSVMYNNFCFGYCNITLTNSSIINQNSTVGMYFNMDNQSCTFDCPKGTYSFLVYCMLCSPECINCVGNANNCTSCTNGLYFFNGTCNTICPQKYLPNLERICTFCNNSCSQGLKYSLNITTIDNQQSLFLTFHVPVSIVGNLYETFIVLFKNRLLQAMTSRPAYQIILLNSQTVQFIFPPGTTATEYTIQIIQPQNVLNYNGQLPNYLTATVTTDPNNVYSQTSAGKKSSISTYFIFLGIISIFSLTFDLQLMRFLQLLYLHYFLVISYPPQLFKIFSTLRYSTLNYLPKLFSVSKAVLRPQVPDTIYNAVGDYSFLRNAGFALTPLLVVLSIWGLLKILSIPEINRYKTLRLWCRAYLQRKFKYAVILEWVSIFITNTVFFAVLQLRDYNLYDSFTQASVVLAHLFILIFVFIIVLQTYKVISFYKEYPQLSQNITKATQIILNDQQAEQLVSTNIFLCQKKKIDLRDMAYPQVNNQNILPFTFIYRFNFLSLLCPSVTYLRALLLSLFISFANKSLQLQMALCIPINVLTLYYFIKSRPYSFNFYKFKFRNYIVLFHQVSLIVFQFLLLVFGIQSSAGATSAQKQTYGRYISYFLASACTVSFLYQLFIIGVFIYRKGWLYLVQTQFFAKSFPKIYAEYQAEKIRKEKLVKSIDPKAKQSLRKLIQGYKKSKSMLRPDQQSKKNPNLPVKYKLTYFNKNERFSSSSKTTLTRIQKKKMLQTIFSEKQDVSDSYKQFEQINEVQPPIPPFMDVEEYEDFEEQIELKAKDLAKYVNNSDFLLALKRE